MYELFKLSENSFCIMTKEFELFIYTAGQGFINDKNLLYQNPDIEKPMPNVKAFIEKLIEYRNEVDGMILCCF